MDEHAFTIEYQDWDWLPEAADDIEDYMTRLLSESAITPHVISARAKTISSFQEKCLRKHYKNPRDDVNDAVAIRVITYSVTDRDRVRDLIRERFEVREDRNPGDERDREHRGYDCWHFIVTGENGAATSGWVKPKLAKYFERFNGLEIQLRTVASHAWAEFEHSRRYKGESYAAIGEHDRETVDQLFRAASDARNALDETFKAVDRVLANPRGDISAGDCAPISTRTESGPSHEFSSNSSSPEGERVGSIEVEDLRALLEARYSEDEPPSEKGIIFARDLLCACRLMSPEDVDTALGDVDSTRVRQLMDTATPVTRVRRLDDDLLARFGERYIAATGLLGNVSSRREQLGWRYDRLRGKLSASPYNLFEVEGKDCPDSLSGVQISAARAVREVARVIAEKRGLESASVDGVVSLSADGLNRSARAKKIEISGRGSLWVATNLNRAASEFALRRLLSNVDGLSLKVMLGDEVLASSTEGSD